MLVHAQYVGASSALQQSIHSKVYIQLLSFLNILVPSSTPLCIHSSAPSVCVPTSSLYETRKLGRSSCHNRHRRRVCVHGCDCELTTTFDANLELEIVALDFSRQDKRIHCLIPHPDVVLTQSNRLSLSANHALFRFTIHDFLLRDTTPEHRNKPENTESPISSSGRCGSKKVEPAGVLRCDFSTTANETRILFPLRH